MSQYPSPYVPPNVMPYYGAPPADMLKSAKRASILMYVLGALVALLGMCNTLSTMAMPADQFMRQAQEMQGSQQQQLPMSAEQFKILAMVFAGLFFFGGLLFIGLGVGVRRGGKVSTIVAMGLTAILLAGGALTFLISIIASLQSPVVLTVTCMLIIPLGLLTWLGFLLIGCLRIMPQMSAAQQQYQAQYWQYQQNMQAYTGYGQQPMPQMGYPTPTQGYAQATPPPGQLPPIVQQPAPPQSDPNSPPPNSPPPQG